MSNLYHNSKLGVWRVHTPNLIKEIVNNSGTGILKIPLNIFSNILASVADRAIEINDPKLNALMIQLTLYENADPESDHYDRRVIEYFEKNTNPARSLQGNK